MLTVTFVGLHPDDSYKLLTTTLDQTRTVRGQRRMAPSAAESHVIDSFDLEKYLGGLERCTFVGTW
jgi:hypothetical protein